MKIKKIIEAVEFYSNDLIGSIEELRSKLML